MMNAKKFSVIIPCYNETHKLKRAVDSCVNQTTLPYEVIIVDDGSTPETQRVVEEISREYASKNVSCFFFKKNGGVSGARNKGMEIATGDFYCFLDSDDIWHRDKLRTINAFLKTQEFPISVSHDFTYDMDDLMKSDPSGSHLPYKKITFLNLLFRNPITTPSLVIPAGLGIKFNEDMTHTEDHDFLLRLSKKTLIIFLSRKLVFIDRKLGSKGGLSGDSWKMRKGEMKMYVNCFRHGNPWYYLLIPLFITFSIVKYIRHMIIRLIR
jgi:teichuronic acid biosynthesis glycosyltransferase TuaG